MKNERKIMMKNERKIMIKKRETDEKMNNNKIMIFLSQI